MSLSAVITPAGVTAPSFADVLAGLQAAVRAIYGSDIYIAPDSKDGQFLALLAQAISDANAAAIAVRADFAPGSAQGAGLSSVVKVNGLARLVASYSTAVGLVVGQVGTVINNGTVKDANGNLWNLPSVVTIPPAGQISVTVTAQQLGALAAGAGTINAIATPVLGWQTFASTSDAAPCRVSLNRRTWRGIAPAAKPLDLATRTNAARRPARRVEQSTRRHCRQGIRERHGGD
jgi:hypothetical protein